MADVLDGRVARSLAVADRTGAFLDSTLDRFAEVGAFVGLAVLFRSSSLTLALAVTAMGGSLLVSYTRSRGESQGVVCKLSLIHFSEPTRRYANSYTVFCIKKIQEDHTSSTCFS